jgi:hypothetical protein
MNHSIVIHSQGCYGALYVWYLGLGTMVLYIAMLPAIVNYENLIRKIY